jgi:site-specific DNA recombinase
MTRTGTRRRDRVYSYYSCGGSQQKGKSVCRGRHVGMARLDKLIVDNVKEHLFGGERLARILDALVERQGAKDQAVEERRKTLEAEIASRADRLQRLYRAIEEGIVELDGDLKARIQTLKQEREVAQAALDRLVVQSRTKAAITPARLEAFSKLMCEKLETADVQARKAYLRSVIAQIEVGDGKIRVFSDKTTLAAAAISENASAPNVRGFVRGWRTRRDSNSRPLPSEGRALSAEAMAAGPWTRQESATEARRCYSC